MTEALELPKPKQDGPGYLSVSRLRTMNDCGEKFRLRYVHGIKGAPSGALIAGRAIHETIAWAEGESLALSDRLDLDNLLTGHFHAALAQELEAAGGPGEVRWAGRKSKQYPEGENDVWWRFGGPMMLRRYVGIRQEDAAKGRRIVEGGVEVEIRAVMPDGRVILGYADKILVADENGELHIRDYKTGGMGADVIQLATYGWMLEQSAGYHVKWGEAVYLRQTDIAKRRQVHDLEPYQAIVPRLYGDLAAMVDNGVYPIKPGPFCKSCDVREYCDYGRLLVV